MNAMISQKTSFEKEMRTIQ
jgi:hypothetical protein